MHFSEPLADLRTRLFTDNGESIETVDRIGA